MLGYRAARTGMLLPREATGRYHLSRPAVGRGDVRGTARPPGQAPSAVSSLADRAVPVQLRRLPPVALVTLSTTLAATASIS